MDETLDRNKMISHSEDTDDYTFKPNFINTPWDDRTRRSKVGILCLLLAIFVATMACVVNNIIMHYKSAASRASVSDTVKCHLEKIDKYNFVARIMSPSGNLLCIGAMMSDKSILTSEVCTKSGPIYLLLGRTTLPMCKKGILIDEIQSVLPPGILSSNLALLKTVRSMFDCGTPLQVGSALDWSQPVTVIGRPSFRSGRSISRQTAILMRVNGDAPRRLSKKFNMDKVLCVRGLVSCPVQAGDLLLQNGLLYGVASISIGGPNQVACFVDLKDIFISLRTLDSDIKMEKVLLTTNSTNGD